MRKFIFNPLDYRLSLGVALLGASAQHCVDVGTAVSVVEPFECVVVIAEIPVDRTVAQLVQLALGFVLATPLAVSGSGPRVRLHVVRDEGGHGGARILKCSESEVLGFSRLQGKEPREVPERGDASCV